MSGYVHKLINALTCPSPEFLKRLYDMEYRSKDMGAQPPPS